MNKIDNSYIRYGNCWEDAQVLIKALSPSSGDQVLSIASAGDNSFALLSEGPKIVLAIDMNECQLFLIELKKVAIEKFTYGDFLGFLGFDASTKRWELFNSIKKELSPACNSFWNQNKEIIEQGVIHSGKFERYLQYFRKKVLPLIHSRKKVDQLLAPKSQNEQVDYYLKHWNSFRWRLLFKVFFGKFIMGRYGRDKQFMNEVSINVGDFIFARSAAHLQQTSCQRNSMLQYMLTGTFNHLLPYYAQEKNFTVIKKNIDRLLLTKGMIEHHTPELLKFNKFNLSNIFEYMDVQAFKEGSAALMQYSTKNTRYAYWNLMVERDMSQLSPSLKQNLNLMTHLREEDMGFFYKGIQVVDYEH